jgi:hypothetical protein
MEKELCWKSLAIILAAAFFIQTGTAQTLDTNTLNPGVSGAKVEGGDYITWVSVGEAAVGETSSGTYIVQMGFYYDNVAPATTASPVTNISTDFNYQFSCLDDYSGCNQLFYSYDDVNFVKGWGSTPDTNIGVVVDGAAGGHTIRYWSSDNMDNNEEISLIEINKSAPTDPDQGTGTTTGGTTTTTNGGTSGTTTTVSSTGEYTDLGEANPTAVEEVQNTLDPNQKGILGGKELSFRRSVQAKGGATGGTNVPFDVKVQLKVKNNSGKKLLDIEVVEEIPKSLAQSASAIKSSRSFKVIKSDPIIAFNIAELLPNQEELIEYEFASTDVTEEKLGEMKAPFSLIALEAVDPCKGIVCRDQNPCTVEYCSNGACVTETVTEGAGCGLGKHCIAGQCVEKPAEEKPGPVTPTEALQGLDLTTLGIAAAVLLTAIGTAGIFLKQQKKGKGKTVQPAPKKGRWANEK